MKISKKELDLHLETLKEFAKEKSLPLKYTDPLYVCKKSFKEDDDIHALEEKCIHLAIIDVSHIPEASGLPVFCFTLFPHNYKTKFAAGEGLEYVIVGIVDLKIEKVDEELIVL